MAYKSLRQYIELLEQHDELIRIKKHVNPILEITEITDRISKQGDGGKAILFENTGTAFPVLINAYGSLKRMCMALGVNNLDDIGNDFRKLFSDIAGPKDSFWKKLGALPQLGKLANWLPSVSNGRGVCQEVVYTNPDINIMPVLQCWPFDGGRFVTLPMVNTKDPETGVRNVGMYRMQVFGEKETGMHWHKHKVGAKHFELYRKIGKPMPVAVALGGDPAYTYAATAPMPENMDEYLLAGFLRKKKVKLVKCLTVDLEIPADVDFVIEGFVDPADDLVWEGPFGDHTGFYSLADWYPRFHITCITHRKNAVYPATIVGVPPMEDAYIAKATERIFLEPIRMTMLPELKDMNLPFEGVAHNIALVRINNSYPGHAYKVMNALWGAGQMMFNKVLVALPKSLNIQSAKEILLCLVNSVDSQNDILFGKGPLDVLDHSSNHADFGSKLFVDATKELDYKQDYSSLDPELVAEALAEFTPEVIAYNISLIRDKIPILFVSINKTGGIRVKELIERMFRTHVLRDLWVIVAVDMQHSIDNLSQVLWFVSGNLDPMRDLSFVDLQDGIRKRIGIDGTRKAYPSDRFKRDWPNIVLMNMDTIDKIDSIWNDLNIGGFIESPSLKLLPLQVGNEAVVRF